MSISYSVNLATLVPPERIAELLAEVGTFTRTDDLDFEGQGVTIGVGRVSRLGQEVLQEEFGVCPAVTVVMHLIPSEGYEEGKANVASIIATLLKQVADDAIVLRNHEDLVLRRKDGRAMLSHDYEAWLSPEFDAAAVRYGVLTATDAHLTTE